MNQALYQSFHSQMSKQNKQEEDYEESYFDDAKQGLMKDLVDFQNRDDFDSYMRSIEKSYYQKLNIPQPPYEVLPDYPPKPYQSRKSKRAQYEDQKRDFIDKVNEINMKRSQAYSEQHLHQQRMMQQQQYFSNLAQPSINPYQNPYFDQMVNKENAGFSSGGYATPAPPTSYPPPLYNVHTPSVGGLHMSQFGGQPPYSMQSAPYNHAMEPQAMQSMAPPYLQKFVAGPTRLEANPLSEPNRNFKTYSPSRQQMPPPQMNDYDLKNPDVQFERYKNLMSNQYYNQHANSIHQGFNINGAHTVYQPPPPFNHATLGAPVPNDVFNVSFNPGAQPGMKQMTPPAYQQTMQPQPLPPQGHIFPQSQQIYPQLSSVSLYQPPPIPPGSLPPAHPAVYRSIKQNNVVDKSIIDSIGGIEDTLKPLEETLKQHELRPFQVQRDYHKEYIYSQRGKELKRSASECKPEHLKLVSVSPFRAVVKIDKTAQSLGYLAESEAQKQQTEGLTDDTEEDDDDDIQRNRPHEATAMALASGQYRQLTTDRNSPIRNDSQNMRGEREQFLTSFNDKRNLSYSLNDSYDKRNPGGQGMKEHQKIRMESEYLRQQREQFLNGFSQAPLLTSQDRRA